MKQRKLVLTTSEECKANLIWSNPRIFNSKLLPLIHYPNYAICWEATDWLLYQWKRGTAKRSLNTYAYKISPFVRYLFNQRRSFDSVDDRLLVDFSIHLLTHQKKSPNNTGDIIRRVLDLLRWLQVTYRFSNKVIAVDDPEAQIRCQMKTAAYRSKNGKKGSINYLHHESIPNREVTQEKRAISNNVIDALWEAVENMDTAFRRERAKTILTLLENTGGRRIEIHKIKTFDIYEAKKTGFLNINSAKKKYQGANRDIPIDISAIKRVIDFIEHERAIVIKKQINRGQITKDSNEVLISIHGSPIVEQTITDEISKLRRISGIVEPAHPHLFRHRFTTLLIDQAHEDLKDQGLGNIGDSVTQKIMSTMGWSSKEMVNRYHDIYVSESEGWKNIEKKLLARLQDDNLQRELISFIDLLRNKDQIGRDEQEDLLLFLVTLVEKGKFLLKG